MRGFFLGLHSSCSGGFSSGVARGESRHAVSGDVPHDAMAISEAGFFWKVCGSVGGGARSHETGSL